MLNERVPFAVSCQCAYVCVCVCAVSCVYEVCLNRTSNTCTASHSGFIIKFKTDSKYEGRKGKKKGVTERKQKKDMGEGRGGKKKRNSVKKGMQKNDKSRCLVPHRHKHTQLACGLWQNTIAFPCLKLALRESCCSCEASAVF